MIEYGLLGKKIEHSFSPIIHKQFGDYRYELIEKNEKEIDSFLREKSFKGINVTHPYKKKAREYCDYIDETAKATDCVNTILNKSGKLYGYNTDYYGFLYMFNKIKIEIEQPKVLIVGDGATSNVVKTALSNLNYVNIKVVSRKGLYNFHHTDYFSDTNILINCTPLGIFPHEYDDYPVNIEKLQQLKIVIDLNYNPLRTKLLLNAKEQNCDICSGLLMLIAQAKKSSEIFQTKSISDKVVDQLHRKMKKELSNIVFIGMPGSGKTTIGRLIAKRMNREFIDTDEEIRKSQGKEPAKIIIDEGEERFRELEKTIIKRDLMTFQKVISVGGGAVEGAENRNYMRFNSIVILLKRNLQNLDIEGRPLSLEGVEKLFAKRKKYYYALSDGVVENNEIESTVEKVIQLYETVTNN